MSKLPSIKLFNWLIRSFALVKTCVGQCSSMTSLHSEVVDAHSFFTWNVRRDTFVGFNPLLQTIDFVVKLLTKRKLWMNFSLNSVVVSLHDLFQTTEMFFPTVWVFSNEQEKQYWKKNLCSPFFSSKPTLINLLGVHCHISFSWQQSKKTWISRKSSKLQDKWKKKVEVKLSLTTLCWHTR